jgi:hypothetical protein
MTTFKKENFITTETCNIIASLIIEKIQERDPKVIAMIWVTWVEKFFIITGRTNLIESFDISKEINEYFEYTEDYDMCKKVVTLTNKVKTFLGKDLVN